MPENTVYIVANKGKKYSTYSYNSVPVTILCKKLVMSRHCQAPYWKQYETDFHMVFENTSTKISSTILAVFSASWPSHTLWVINVRITDQKWKTGPISESQPPKRCTSKRSLCLRVQRWVCHDEGHKEEIVATAKVLIIFGSGTMCSDFTLLQPVNELNREADLTFSGTENRLVCQSSTSLPTSISCAQSSSFSFHLFFLSPSVILHWTIEWLTGLWSEGP